MAGTIKLGIVSDIHYAGPSERAGGRDYELRKLNNPLLRSFLHFYRRYVWLHDPLAQNHLLDKFLSEADGFDYLIANGDYSCDCGSMGVSSDAACESAKECLKKLRSKYDTRFRGIYGDHELGKLSLFGGHGGMRLLSWQRAQAELGLQPFWKIRAGKYLLVGVVSSLIALPLFEPDTLPSEWPEWQRLREDHLAQIRSAFKELEPQQRVLLFCHDPTALPFLWREEAVRSRLPQVEQTIIGHLHSELILWKSRLLAGMPTIGFLGHTPKRMTTALNEARLWRPFHLRLCPALAGIELLKDGGYLTAELDPEARQPARFAFRPVPR
jgi:hypothetical protein